MRPVAGLVVLVVLGLAAAPVAAHTNHVAADAQVSPDGVVVVEAAFVAADGFLGLHRDDGGEIGEPIGHRFVAAEGGLKTDVGVRMDPDAWETGTIHVVLHNDDGDGTFEPGKDRVLSSFGTPAAATIELARGPRAVVSSERFRPERTDTPVATVRNVTLPERGHLVLTAEDGQVVGNVTLDADTHTDVNVPLDREFFREQVEPFALVATVYGDDGDGAFGAGDRAVRAGESAVETTFHVEPVGERTPTTTPGEGAGTPTHGEDHEAGKDRDHSTPTQTPTPSLADAASDTPASTIEAPPETTTGSGDGLGVVLAVAAVVAVAVVVRWRRR